MKTWIITGVIIFFVVGLYLLFLIPVWIPKSQIEEIKTHDFTARSGKDRVRLLEDPVEAGTLRIRLIQEAEESIDVCYHTLSEGQYSNYFFRELIQAADRGVKVRVLWDGLIGGMKGDLKKALSSHENISLYLYEQFKILKPWSLHNRLHDKILLVDGKYLITGGRNIADKLYQPPTFKGEKVFDRDILIVRGDDVSVLNSTKEYYDQLCASQCTKLISKNEPEALAKYRDRVIPDEIRAFYSYESTPYEDMTMPVDSITLVTNPIGRGKKHDVIWQVINSLVSDSKDNVVIQSPYIIPTLSQKDDIRKWTTDTKFITNSITTTPNIPGYTAAMREKPFLKRHAEVRQYEGEGSIHAKSLVIDDNLTIIGSFNLDPRSTHLDTESMYVISSPEMNAQLRNILSMWEGETDKPEVHSWFKEFIFAILSVVTFPIKSLV